VGGEKEGARTRTEIRKEELSQPDGVHRDGGAIIRRNPNTRTPTSRGSKTGGHGAEETETGMKGAPMSKAKRRRAMTPKIIEYIETTQPLEMPRTKRKAGLGVAGALGRETTIP
jgi:hypothetical protein